MKHSVEHKFFTGSFIVFGTGYSGGPSTASKCSYLK
jgi:hypothetical protein